MRRREFLAGVAVALSGTVPHSWAAEKGHRTVGTLDTGHEPLRANLWNGLKARLAELGFPEGRNVTFASAWGADAPDRLPALAAELVRRPVDVIVTAGTLAGVAARRATKSIPIVLATSGDPVSLGLVESLSRPGGNVTGVVSLEELGPKRLELLRELVPGVERIAVLWNRTSPSAQQLVEQIKDASFVVSGMQVEPIGVHPSEDFDEAFSTAIAERAQALIVVPSPAFFGKRQRIAQLALQHRLPLVTGHREYVHAGALAGYAPNIEAVFRHAALYVQRILSGANPADLPLEEPTTFELAINAGVAKVLGLTIPPSVLARADEVIE